MHNHTPDRMRDLKIAADAARSAWHAAKVDLRTGKITLAEALELPGIQRRPVLGLLCCLPTKAARSTRPRSISNPTKAARAAARRFRLSAATPISSLSPARRAELVAWVDLHAPKGCLRNPDRWHAPIKPEDRLAA